MNEFGGGYSNNIYYYPEKNGVEIIAQCEADLSWEFDITLLIKYENNYYMVSDSGCSCPVPFEDVESVADLTPVRSMADVERELRGKTTGWNSYATKDVLDFKRKAREVLACTCSPVGAGFGPHLTSCPRYNR